MHQTGRIRLLVHLVEVFPWMIRDRIYAAILCGEVKVDGIVERNPGILVSPDSDFRLEPAKFVGRGGLKLDGVLDEIDFQPAGKVCLDAGASTGGFTDCLLQRSAQHVHAVDVGFNQIAWKLRSDDRVTVHGRTNVMDLSPGNLRPSAEMAVADLSFRSLRKVASRLLVLTGGGPVLALVKPQFESPLEEGFNGVVRTSRARREVLWTLKKEMLREEVHVLDGIVSPVIGRKGNAEIFLLLSTSEPPDGGHVNRRLTLALDKADAMMPYSKSSLPNGSPIQNPSPPRKPMR